MGKSEDGKKCYNPYRQFVGAFIPTWLLSRKELSFGAKVVFGILTKAAGANGEAFIGREKIASDLSITSRTVQKYLNELYAHELILAHARSHSGGDGTGGTNKYIFLDHPWISWKDKETVHFRVVNGGSRGVVKDRSGGDGKDWVYPQVVNGRSRGDRKDWVSENPNLPKGSEHPFTGVVNARSLHIKDILKDILKESPKRENQIVDNFYFFEAAGLDAGAETRSFERLIISYPKNPHLLNIHALRHAWAKRRKEGHLATLIIDRASGYHQCCAFKNLIGERGVMGINRFLGEEKHFLNDWHDEERQLRKEHEDGFGVKS